MKQIFISLFGNILLRKLEIFISEFLVIIKVKLMPEIFTLLIATGKAVIESYYK